MSTIPSDGASLREWQAFHARLDECKSFDRDLLHNVAYLCGEIGELVGVLQDLRRREPAFSAERSQSRVGEELADILAYVLKLASYAGIDLQTAYSQDVAQSRPHVAPARVRRIAGRRRAP
jgi:NTP pyrophosphatase (non-canonical NTP hydrolase)